MSTYDYSHLIKLWSTGSITSEQAIGQVILHLQSLRDRVQVLEKVVPQQELERLTTELINEAETVEIDATFDQLGIDATRADATGADATKPSK